MADKIIKLPEILILLVTKKGCGICELFRSVFRRLKDDRPNWFYNEIHLVSDAQIAEMLSMYPMMDKTPFTVVLVDGVVKGTINGTLRYTHYINKIDEFVISK